LVIAKPTFEISIDPLENSFNISIGFCLIIPYTVVRILRVYSFVVRFVVRCTSY